MRCKNTDPADGRSAAPRILAAVTLAAVTLAALAACGGDAPKPAAPSAETDASPAAAPQPIGDATLAAARASIAEGVIAPEWVAKITASQSPAHARAQRLLQAMAEPADAGTGTPEVEAPAGAPADAPVLRAPALPNAPVDPVPPVDPKAAPPASPASKPSGGDPPPPAAPAAAARPAAPTVSSLSMKSTKAGATLTIRGSGKLMVGSANQLASGRVHLVVDQAKASGAVASARPSVDGVAVTAVRKGQGTVQITVTLDPGWTLGSIRSFSGGTRVKFVAP